MYNRSLKTGAVVPRGTHLIVADIIRKTIELRGYTDRLPTMRELTGIHGVSRSVVGRALNLLKDEGLVEPVQGVAWYVTGSGDHRPADVRMREMITSGTYTPGQPFPSEKELTEQLGLSRVSIRGALARLEGEGLISKATPRGRTILAISTDKEAS